MAARRAGIGVRRAGMIAGGATALVLIGALLNRQLGDRNEVFGEIDSLPAMLAGDTLEPIQLIDDDTATADPASAAAPAPAVLTRADSMAIAEAVQRRLARENERSRTPSTAARRDSIEEIVSRRMIDSLVELSEMKIEERFSAIRGLEGRVFTVPAPGTVRSWSWSGVRPVLIVPVDEDSRFADVERAISDTLRRVLARSSAFRPMATPDQPGTHPTGVELVVTIRVDAHRGDSVRTRIELIDPLAAPSLMHRVVSGKPLPRPEAVREARELSMIAMTTLTQMSRAPRGGMGVMAETPRSPEPPRP